MSGAYAGMSAPTDLSRGLGNAAGRQAGLSAPTSHMEKYCDPPP